LYTNLCNVNLPLGGRVISYNCNKEVAVYLPLCSYCYQRTSKHLYAVSKSVNISKVSSIGIRPKA
jgi:hypothetical protein